MLDILWTVTPSPEQWQTVIQGARNPKNSWDKSDSSIEWVVNDRTGNMAPWQFHLGDADHDLLWRLAKAGTDHGKFLRMLPVWVTINAPLYWWKEFDTYKVGTVANSCSTMHKITSRYLTMDDFSCELMVPDALDVLKLSIEAINDCIDVYRNYEEYARKGILEAGVEKKTAFDNIIQLLPTSYNQRRTVMLNYEVLRNIYRARRNHKLTEWHTFCGWIEGLPYSDLITG